MYSKSISISLLIEIILFQCIPDCLHFLNFQIDADYKRITRKQYNEEINEVVDRIEDGGFVTQEETEKELSKLEPMSMSSFHEMIDLAKQDHDAGRVISHEDLKKRVKTWK